jgi:hypothetical protein
LERSVPARSSPFQTPGTNRHFLIGPEFRQAWAQQRDFAAAESAVLVEGLLNTIELLRSFIDVSKRFLGVDGAGVLDSLHRIIHPKLAFLSPGQADL